jgi:hypothetical protein
MQDPLEFIRRGILGCASAAEEHRWEDVEAAMWQLTSAPPTPEVEGVLVGVLRFEGQIRLAPSSELPHSMSPEEMLKSLAIQALGRWTGLTYLREMQRVQATAASPVLSGIARAMIERARQAKERTTDLERVAESSPEGPARTVIRTVGQDREMTFLTDRRVRRRELQPVG